MDEIEQLILESWQRVKPRLLQNPRELKRRLARQNSRSLSRPPRAWCLAIRASDRRLAEYSNNPERAERVEVVDADMLDYLCRPRSIMQGGETWEVVAKRLGRGFTGLYLARIKGKIQSQYIRGWAGRFGPPVPLLSSGDGLDPDAHGFEQADEVWGWTGSYNPKQIPADLEARLTRVPVYHRSVARRHLDDSMHPEVRDSASERGARSRLPAPPPDYVWYKWSKSGEYLGDDRKNWRTSPGDPGMPGGFEKPKRSRKAKEKLMRGSLAFRGWMWICPKCGKKVRVVYLPLMRMSLIESEGVGCEGVMELEEDLTPSLPHTITPHVSGFACYACHRIRSFSRIDAKNSWNELIGYLSGGLLYGREVPRPEWFDEQARRKVEYRPRARPAPRREQVLRRMLNGWTISQIAMDLRMCKQQVCDCIRKLCRQENVKNRRELAKKLGSPHVQPMLVPENS